MASIGSMTLISFFFLFSISYAAAGLRAKEYWVSKGENDTLKYKATPEGDRIMDFSRVGYLSHAAPLPNVPVRIALRPSGGSDTQQIQRAIDAVSAMPMNERTGYRGAIKLEQGTFDVRGSSFLISSSGVVIEGSGIDKTMLSASPAREGKPLFYVNHAPKHFGPNTTLTARITSTVASGSNIVAVNSTIGFARGDRVLVVWPQTEEWIRMMNMTQRWEPRNSLAERIVVRVDQATNQIILNTPVPFRIDLKYIVNGTHAYVAKEGRQKHLGFVGLRYFTAMQKPQLPFGNGSFLNLALSVDSWVSHVKVVNFGGNTITVSGKRITIENVELIRTTPQKPKSSKSADLAIVFPGSQILVQHSTITGNGEYSFITRDGANGPNVFYNCTVYGTAQATPKGHFATGILYDSCNFPTGGSIALVDIEHGHAGYGAGYSVVWNSNSASLSVVNPPGAANWAIGSMAKKVNAAISVKPGFMELQKEALANITSLYKAQYTAALRA